MAVAKQQSRQLRLFCQLLYYTGARIAEIHNLTAQSIDFSNKTVIIESLKNRKQGICREIPIPDFLLKELEGYIQDNQLHPEACIWSFSLRTTSRQIKRIMNTADIMGVRGCAKGLRHGFAVHAVTKVPLTLVKKWLGHGALATNEIYLNILGAEEWEIARRIW